MTLTTDKMNVVKRRRTSWGPMVVKCGDELNLVIVYKDSRGHISRYSKSPIRASVKVPWGPPDSCAAGSCEVDGQTELFLR